MRKNVIFFLLFTLIALVSCQKEEATTTIIEEPIEEGRGLAESDSTDLDTAYQLKNVVISTNLPTTMELDMPTAGNQGNQGSCVAWSTAYAARSVIYHYASKTGYMLPNGNLDKTKVFSPAYIYNQTKTEIGQHGMKVSTAMRTLKQQGVCTLADMPYQVKDYLTQPNAAQKTAAAQYKIKDFKFLDKKQRGDTLLLKNLIANKLPIVGAFNLGTTFKSAASGNNNYIWHNSQPDGAADHAMVICGYDDRRQAFKVLNSWGERWGQKGYIWLDYGNVKNVARELWIIIP